MVTRRRCEPNCRCGRHRNGVSAVIVVPRVAGYRKRFLEEVPSPYICAYCGKLTRLDVYRNDGDYLVLGQCDGDVSNMATTNLVPYHRRCRLTIQHRSGMVRTCQCGLTTNAGAMAGHLKASGHVITVTTLDG